MTQLLGVADQLNNTPQAPLKVFERGSALLTMIVMIPNHVI